MSNKERNRQFAAEAFATIAGKDPREDSASMSLQEQRVWIAERVREILDKGFSPYVLIEMLIGGLAFLGDNFGVSREQMARAIVQLALENRTLVYRPDGTPIKAG